MASRARSPSRRRYGRRKSYLWVPASIVSQSIAQNGQVITDLFSGLATEVTGPATIERVIGTVSGRTTLSDTLGVLSFGVTLIEQDAFTGGLVPDHVDQEKWLWKDVITMYGGLVTDNPSQMVQKNVDARARRKVGDRNNRLTAILENISNVAATIEALWHLRILLSK